MCVCYQVLTPVLRCIGNVVCGASDDLATTICNNMQLFESFSKLVQSEHLHLRKESLWVLSNLTGMVFLFSSKFLQVVGFVNLCSFILRKLCVYMNTRDSVKQLFVNVILHMLSYEGIIKTLVGGVLNKVSFCLDAVSSDL